MYIYIYTQNLLRREQVCLMFNERCSFKRHFFHNWPWLNMFMMWKIYCITNTEHTIYILYISVTHKVLRSCRSKMATLTHYVCDMHGASSLYIKACWQSLYWVFPTGRDGRVPSPTRNLLIRPSPPNFYSLPPKVNSI